MEPILKGVRVLGLEQQVAGPTCTMMLPDPIVGKLMLIGSPIKMEEHEPYYAPLPRLGADTDEVLALIGYAAAKICALHEVKTI